jgi:uncharacterized membrane protein (UPF0127 family)
LARAAASLSLVSILLLPSFAHAADSTSPLIFQTDSGPHRFNIELATTDEQRRLGLMYRRHLADDAGMLFIYDHVKPISMWMKNTYMSLDMIFITADGKVQRIEEHTEPFSLEPISSDGAVRGVLEVKAGTAKAIGLKPGDEVIYPGLGTAPKP